MKRIIPMLILAALAMPAAAQSSDDEARAVLALVKARADRERAAPKVAAAPLPWKEAREQALASGKSILVRVADFPCLHVCPKLSPEMVMSHTDSLNGRPGLVLVIPDPSGACLWEWKAWATVPTEKDIKAADAAGRAWIKARADLKNLNLPQKCSCKSCPDGPCTGGGCVCSYRPKVPPEKPAASAVIRPQPVQCFH